MKPILLLGEARGANEDRIQSSFVGASGIELLRMLNDAQVIELSAEAFSLIKKFWDTADPLCIDAVWHMHPEVIRANVFNFHPLANDMASLYGEKREAIAGYPVHKGGKAKKQGYIRAEFVPELERLADEIVAIDPNVIVGFGNTPLWALCGMSGISKIRGTTRLTTHTATGFKFLPTIHPAAVLQQWEYRPTVISDLMKAKRENEYPEIRRPQRFIWIEPTLEDIERFINEHVRDWLSVDIETSGNQITCVGFSPSEVLAIVVPFFDERKKSRSYWPNLSDEQRAWELIRGPLENRNVRKIFQNGLYDIAFLLRSQGIKVRGAEDDTMLCHHALQPESLKGLGFLGSIYCDEGAWKQERGKMETIKRDE